MTGKIVNWETGYCYKCRKQYNGRLGLLMHVLKSKAHKKQSKNYHQSSLDEMFPSTVTLGIGEFIYHPSTDDTPLEIIPDFDNYNYLSDSTTTDSAIQATEEQRKKRELIEQFRSYDPYTIIIGQKSEMTIKPERFSFQPEVSYKLNWWKCDVFTTRYILAEVLKYEGEITHA